MSRARVLKRPFVKARAFWVGKALPGLVIGTAREPGFFTDFGDGPLDAPGMLPAGSMRGDGENIMQRVTGRGQ